MYGIIGFTITNIFVIIYGIALQVRPEKANEISGLMITGVFRGEVVPFLMGVYSYVIGYQAEVLFVILRSALYLTFTAFALKVK